MSAQDNIVFSLFLIFSGAAILSTVALWTRQSLLVGYMILGLILGPSVLNWFSDASEISQIGEIGIIFLLFLLGLHLEPQNLLHMFRKATGVALVSSLVFMALGVIVARIFSFTWPESWIIGAAMMFSSTIIGLKLLPTTILHHQHTGEVMISVLLMQDLIAIISLVLLQGEQLGGVSLSTILLLIIALPALLLVAFIMERWILRPLLARFDQVQEYLFLIAIGWCLGMAELATLFKLSAEIGAFIGGVAIAASPIARFIAESLKPLRDFFLVMFFFAVGAEFDIFSLKIIIIPALVLTAITILVKPWTFKYLLRWSGESKKVSWEAGVRLAQGSEFSLLLASMAAGSQIISNNAFSLIQAMTMLSFIISSYWVVMRYPTPLAFKENLRRD
ncbi:MAG: cation:proton antiporter [Legionellales bacterium]|nr:cation:proton antiporter [Legionellales bacterium]